MDGMHAGLITGSSFSSLGRAGTEGRGPWDGERGGEVHMLFFSRIIK